MAIKTFGVNSGNGSIIPDPIYGSGKDGNYTASANITLSRNMYYNNLTINSGVHVNTNGHRVFVRNIFLLNSQTANDSSTSLGLKQGSSVVGSISGGSITNVTNSLGGSSASYTATQVSSTFGGADYFDDPDLAVNAYILNASQTTPLMLRGGAGDGTNSGGGVVVISARRVSGNGTIYANGYNNGSSYTTGGGVIIYCSSKIRTSGISLNVSGYSGVGSGTIMEFIV